jgi:hypothetical protein
MNLGVNFIAQKVEGADLFGDIARMNELMIEFESFDQSSSFDQSNKVTTKIEGSTDRTTGELYAEATTTARDPWLSQNYSLKCNPTQRMF